VTVSAPNLLPIGTFARACKLTVKALRHYDQLGLLRPARVDPATGYRYYRPDQAREAITIGLLRSIDLPLPTIREVLAGNARAALETQRERIDRDRTRAEHAITILDHYLEAGATLTEDIAVRLEPASRLASQRLIIPAHSEVAATAQAFVDLTKALDEAGCPWDQPVLTLLHDAGEHLTIDVAVGFTDDPARLPAPTRHLELAAGPVVETLHHGPYEAAGIAHAAIHAWVQEHGHRPAGPFREIYLNDPATTPAAALLTRVLMPIDPDM
jgi:DNA-binding transcriptional MerR regulator